MSEKKPITPQKLAAKSREINRLRREISEMEEELSRLKAVRKMAVDPEQSLLVEQLDRSDLVVVKQNKLLVLMNYRVNAMGASMLCFMVCTVAFALYYGSLLWAVTALGSGSLVLVGDHLLTKKMNQIPNRPNRLENEE